MNTEKEQWIEGVLAAAEGIERAKAPLHFYSRTMARIKEEGALSRGYVLRIAAGLALLVALNVFACAAFSHNNGLGSNHQLEAFAKEYNIATGGDSF